MYFSRGYCPLTMSSSSRVLCWQEFVTTQGMGWVQKTEDFTVVTTGRKNSSRVLASIGRREWGWYVNYLQRENEKWFNRVKYYRFLVNYLAFSNFCFSLTVVVKKNSVMNVLVFHSLTGFGRWPRPVRRGVKRAPAAPPPTSRRDPFFWLTNNLVGLSLALY